MKSDNIICCLQVTGVTGTLATDAFDVFPTQWQWLSSDWTLRTLLARVLKLNTWSSIV